MANILVVEDEKAVRENILELLQSEGFTTFEAVNGQEGLFAAHREKIDLILCDIMMPIMDGYQLLSILRRYPHTMLIPLIFLTAKGERDDQRAGMDLGAEDYITKPFGRLELLHSIQRRLQRRNELDAAIAQKNKDILQDGTLALPYEFISSLSIIHSLSESIMERTQKASDLFIHDAAGIISRAVTNLKDISSKYIFINDLESKNDLPNLSSFNNEAKEQIIDIITEKAKDYQFEQPLLKMENFSCKLTEIHLTRLIESVISEIFRDADSKELIKVVGENIARKHGYRIKVSYFELVPHDDALITDDIQRYHLIKEQMSKKQLIHLAHLLNCKLEFLTGLKQAKAILIIPSNPLEE